MMLDKLDTQEYLRCLYILDFLQTSGSHHSAEELSRLSPYRIDEIQRSADYLRNRGVLDECSEGYISNQNSKKPLDDEVYRRIEESYDRYLEATRGLAVMTDGDHTIEYPLKSSVSEEHDNINANVFDITTGAELEYHLTKSDDLPNLTELSYRNLQRYPIQAMKLLWVTFADDLVEYWEFTFEVFHILDYRGQDAWSTMQAISLLFRLVLASHKTGPINIPVQQARSPYQHLIYIMQNTSFIASYVAYPALEAYLKFKCESDIEPDGTIKESGRVGDFRPGSDQEYYKKGQTCSSVCDLLIHFEEKVADAELSKQLVKIREQIAELVDYDPERIYGLIYQWRNKLSHEAEINVRYGIILNLICMLIWSDVNKRVS